MQEVKDSFLKSTSYVNTTGKISFSIQTDTSNFLMANLIKNY